MSENQPIKPQAKFKHHKIIPLRPTTDGHELKEEVDPEIERNEPSFTEEKLLRLNPDAKAYIPKHLANALYNKDPKKEVVFQNNTNYPNHPYYNNYNNMNMPPMPNYYQPMQGYNPQVNNPYFNPMNMSMYNPRQSPQNFDYQRGPPNMMYPNQGYNYSNNNNNFNNSYNPNYNPNHNNNYNNNRNNPVYNKKKIENNNPQKKFESKTSLSAKSTPFIPSSKREDKTPKPEKKEENTAIHLNIDAPLYTPQNKNLLEKDNLAQSKKEEKTNNQDIKKKENPLTKLLENSPKEKSKEIHRFSEKNISTNAKWKNKKSTEFDKKFENIKKNKERIKREEDEKKKREDEERKIKEEEEKRKREEEKKRKEEEERKKKEEEERKKKEEEERKKYEEEKIIERKYFITFKNKKSEKKEKFTFEYIMQFKKWKIAKEDDLLTKEVKEHFEGFKEELKEGLKKRKDREDGTKKKEHYTKQKPKESSEKKLPAVSSMEQWARKDMSNEIKAAAEFKQKLMEEAKVESLKKDLRDLLNKLTEENYKEMKELILEKIKDSTDNQEKFLDVLFQKAVMEKSFVKLYSRLVKELDKELPQKSKRKEKDGEKKKKEYSEMRSHLIDKCRTIFQIENNEKFDEYIKEKDPEERRNKLKKFILGNVNFIAELMKIKILSKKVGPDCLKNLYDRYQSGKLDKTLKELTIEAIIVFTEKFGRIVYEEEKTMKQKDKEEFKSKIDDIFKKLEKIKEEPGLVGYIKYGIINLEEKRKENFAMSKFDESQIAKTKKEVEKELENEGQITQENINQKMKKELKVYKESLENVEEGEETDDPWKLTTFIMEKRKTYGKTFGDIIEGYFECAAEIIDEEKEPDYIKKYIDELIEFYAEKFSKKDIKELKERLIKLSEYIVENALDIPGLYDIYAYVLNNFMENELMKFSDLAELKKQDITIENISEILKNLAKYYDKESFKEELKELPYVKTEKEKFKWAFE